MSVLGDAIAEHSGTFTVTLSNPVGATLSDAHGAGTIATDDMLTDESLSSGATEVGLVHLVELRQNLDRLRIAYGLGTFGWTDASLVAGQTPIRGTHLTDLRVALQAVYVAAGVAPPAYTDPVIGGGAILIKAVHVHELRAAIKAVP